MFRSLVRIVLGLTVAAIVAGLVQVLFVMPPADLVSLDRAALAERLQSGGFLMLLAATQTAVFSAPFAVIVVALGEWQGIRSWFYYAFAGLMIAIAGFLAQYAGESGPLTIVNDYALWAYATTGVMAGLAYWWVAGRRAGGTHPPPPHKPTPRDRGYAASRPPTRAD